MLPWIRTINKKRKTVASLFWVVTVFVFSLIVLHPHLALAQDTFGVQQIDTSINLGNQDIRVIIAKIIRVFLGLLGVIALGINLYAGYTIMTSEGNEEELTKGRKILTNGIIGLVIILSAFSITQYIINKLSEALGRDINEQVTIKKPVFDTFSGSGGLGKVVKDHFPAANQKDIPRNTKIAVTFAEAIDPSSLIKNTNGTCWSADGSGTPTTTAPGACKKDADGQDMPFYGDCLDTNHDGTISWETECDRLTASSVHIYQTDTPNTLFEAAALAVYDQDASAYTFVFRPLQYLGDSTKNVWHTVDLLSNIRKVAGNQSAFVNQFSDHYKWQFETNTTVDFTPPHVVGTSPATNESIPKNTVIRVDFSEPVDPTVTQGVLSNSSLFSNLIFNSSTIEGQWKITNGYTSVEFVSNIPCGQNSCGSTMYCLPVACTDSNDTACTTAYAGLVRTGELANAADKTFVALPFTGVMDMAGNALDNGPGPDHSDGVLAIPHKPALSGGNHKTIGAQEQSYDNYWWNFTVENRIDRSAPYIHTVEPGIDNEGVKGDKPVTIHFSKSMWLDSLDGITLDEYPEHVKGLDTFSFYRRAQSDDTDHSTILQLSHPREFGPNGLDLYYFTTVSSSVMSANQNCLYPGRGPDSIKKSNGASPNCVVTYNEAGETTSQQNCVQVNVNPTQDTGCVTTNATVGKTQSDVATCLKALKSTDVSPVTNQ